jgi:hypothetical protein
MLCVISLKNPLLCSTDAFIAFLMAHRPFDFVHVDDAALDHHTVSHGEVSTHTATTTTTAATAQQEEWYRPELSQASHLLQTKDIKAVLHSQHFPPTSFLFPDLSPSPTSLLHSSIIHIACLCSTGALAYVCMVSHLLHSRKWIQLEYILSKLRRVFGSALSAYRSRHE